MIYAMDKVSSEQKQLLVTAIETGGDVDLSAVLELIRASGALDLTRTAALAEAQRAINSLQCLPVSPYKTALLQLASSLQNRRN
jgi:octaprenyl-diphosphate synthase